MFQRKTLIIEMMNVSGQVVGINILFPEHNSALVTNILMVHGRIVAELSVGSCI